MTLMEDDHQHWIERLLSTPLSYDDRIYLENLMKNYRPLTEEQVLEIRTIEERSKYGPDRKE